ncbi:TonB-dependent receptor domain-containing protein [Parasphingopyxis lamellibrachiae]|uniref:TonB-dependent receptor-like protein n=1 Tax=Parasphingopyxis lamellibrachiae TaxID=680125 RepID=A0A3D9FG12_9SPHN|nr:TonB-dependent receptor [Parasphingopyxis lamellibrachiae]RED16760.1 TonB-dependent receptor-like protein [Parasphingopyxis lamellibrachiae]
MTKQTNGKPFSVRAQTMRAMLLGTAASAFVATPAFAQDNDELAATTANQPSIVVTGTRITNPNLDQSSPIQVVGADEIDYRQATNAEELIGELPGIAPGTNSSVNNGSNGTSTLNLRNIANTGGATRSLVLLDGTRLVPSTIFSQTDLNIIPVALVERVEVITGGASSVYGADAISGVANFVLRRDFEGLEAAVTFGINERGDGERIRGDVTIGANFDDGRGNASLSIGYQEVDDVLQSNRVLSQQGLFGTTVIGSGTTVPTRFNGNQIDPTGTTLVPTYNTFNFAPFNYFQTPLERYNIFGSANYEVTPGIEIYTRAMFTNSTVSLQLAPSGLFGDPFALPLNNPFLTDTQVQQICASFAVPIDPATCTAARNAADPNDPNFLAPDVIINRRLVEQGPRQTDLVTNQFQLWAGVRGDISDTVGYDVYATYGESQRTTTRRNWGLKSRIEQALNATSTTTCFDASNGCFPINLQGGGPGGTNIDPRSVAFFNQPSGFTDSTSLSVVNASLNGTFGETGFFTQTPIGFAVGVEYREYNASRVADVSAGTQDEVLGTGAPAPTFNGGYDVIEGFAELIVPILEDVPGFYSLQAEGGIRVSDYSNTGTSVTWKAGGSWEPFEGFRFRGIYSVSVRSPNIGELFAPVTTGLTPLAVDPCAGANPVGNATLTAICIAQGAPAATIGLIPQPSAAQINATAGGNTNLDVEEAESITLGLVATPPQVPGLVMSIDYFNIKVTGAITNPTPGDILTPCFGANGDGNGSDPAQCANVGRNPINGSMNGGGETLGLILQLSNLGAIETSGVDFRVAYRFPLSFGSLNFDLNGTWTDELLFQATPSAINRECVGLYSNNCEPITPEWAFNLRTTVSIDDLVDISLLWRWIDGVEYEFRGRGDGFTDEQEAIDAASYFDLTVRSNVSENFDITLGIQNLLDRSFPNVSSFIGSSSYNSGNTYPTTYDTLGRRYSVTGRVRF